MLIAATQTQAGEARKDPWGIPIPNEKKGEGSFWSGSLGRSENKATPEGRKIGNPRLPLNGPGHLGEDYWGRER